MSYTQRYIRIFESVWTPKYWRQIFLSKVCRKTSEQLSYSKLLGKKMTRAPTTVEGLQFHYVQKYSGCKTALNSARPYAVLLKMSGTLLCKVKIYHQVWDFSLTKVSIHKNYVNSTFTKHVCHGTIIEAVSMHSHDRWMFVLFNGGLNPTTSIIFCLYDRIA